MEEEKLSLFEETPNLTDFFKNSRNFLGINPFPSIGSSQKRSGKMSYIENPKLKEEFLKDLVVIPKLANRHRKMSE